MSGKRAVYQWGNNKNISEIQDLSSKQIIQICCGGDHILALSRLSEIYVWGDNRSGQLGLDKEISRAEEPILIPKFANEPIVRVQVGILNSAAFTDDGNLYMWGLTQHGPQWVPTSIYSQYDFCGGRIIDIQFTLSIMIVLLQFEERTEVWSWGSGPCLGQGDNLSINQPTPIECLTSIGICSIVAGEKQIAALTESGRLYVWGNNESKSLGLGLTGTVNIPVIVDKLNDIPIKQVVCGDKFIIALAKGNGGVYAWGYGRHGVLGHGGEEFTSEPTLIRAFADKRITYLSCGGLHTIARTDKDEAYTWGIGGKILGLDDKFDKLSPTLITSLPNYKILQISCNYHYSLILVATNKITVHYKYLKQEFSIVGLDSIRDLYLKAAKLWQIKDINNWIIRDISGFEMDFEMLLTNLEDGVEDMFILRPVDAQLLEDYELTLSPSSGSVPDLVGCTKERYLEWITQTFEPGQELVNTFLLNFQLFGYKAEELVDDLILRYENGESPLYAFKDYNELLGSKIVNFCGIKKRVLQLIDKWVSKYSEDIVNNPLSAKIIQSIISFLEKHPALYFPCLYDSIRSNLEKLKFEKRGESIRGFVSTIPTKISLEEPPTSDPPLHQYNCDIFKYTPREMARHFAVITSQYLSKISSKELLWPYSPDLYPNFTNLTSFINFFERIKDWIIFEILNTDTPQTRYSSIQIFIDIASESRMINDFSTVYAILSALQSLPIKRLKSSWSCISNDHSSRYGVLQQIGAYDSYKQFFSKLPEPKISFLGFSIHDIKQSKTVSPIYINDRLMTINISKFTKITSLIQEISSSFQSQYPFSIIRELHSMINSAIGLQSFTATYNLSRLIEEDNEYDQDNMKIDRFSHYLRSICQFSTNQTNNNIQGNNNNNNNNNGEFEYEDDRTPASKRIDQEIALLIKYQESNLEDRTRLWKQWLQKLQSPPSIFAGSLRAKGNNPESLSFKDALLKSKALQASIQSILEYYPTDTDLVILESIFSHLCKAGTDIPKLFSILKQMSQCPLTIEMKSTIANILNFYKPFNSSSMDKKRNQSVFFLESAKEKERSGSNVDDDDDDWGYMIDVSFDLAKAYSMKLDLVEEELNKSKVTLSLVDSQHHERITQFFDNPKSGMSLELQNLKVNNDNQLRDTQIALSSLEEDQIQEEESLQELIEEEKKLSLLLQEIKARKNRSLEKIRFLKNRREILSLKSDNNNQKVKRNLDRKESFLNNNFETQEITNFLQVDYKHCYSELLKQSEILGRDYSDAIDEFTFGLEKYLTQLQQYLSKNRLNIAANKKNEILARLKEIRVMVSKHDLLSHPKLQPLLKLLKFCSSMLNY